MLKITNGILAIFLFAVSVISIHGCAGGPKAESAQNLESARHVFLV